MATPENRKSLQQEGTTAGRPTGRLFILSAPSGAGKTTLCEALRRLHPELAYSVSFTTRRPRQGETDGKDYHFISKDEFEAGIADGRWAEWAEVHGNYYGTSALWIDQTLNSGEHVLMDIDMQGARQMVARFPEAITVFIMPPSMEELERRLRSRGTDAETTISLRLSNALEEIDQRECCRHILINDDLEKTIQQLAALVEKYQAAESDG